MKNPRFALTIYFFTFFACLIFKFTPTVWAATPTPNTSLSFEGGFEDGVVYQYPNAINNWHDPLPYEAIPTRLTLVTNPVRKGNYALRVEVRPGDNLGSSGERAEVYGMYGTDGNQIFENEASGTQFFTLSVYLPVDFVAPYNSLHPGVDSVWGCFEQLHGSDVYHAPPPFAIGATDTYYVQMWSGDIDEINYNDPTKFWNARYPLGALQRGKWVDFVWKIKFAKTFTGSVEVWKRMEGENDFTKVLTAMNIPTLQFKTSYNNGVVLPAYWKTGYYTSEETFTRIIYLDSHTRGSSFNEVVATAFPAISSSPSPTPTHCSPLGDIDCSGQVNLIDLSKLLLAFSQSNPPNNKEDLDNSGKVNALDLSILLANFGKSQ